MHKKMVLLGIAAGLIWLLVACTAATGDAPTAVANYFEALAAKDEARLANLSCGDWEAQARAELNSFAAVDVELEDVACQPAGTEGDFTLVTCSGKIIANYGAEVLEINLAERVYRAAFESNEWRMCGYQ